MQRAKTMENHKLSIFYIILAFVWRQRRIRLLGLYSVRKATDMRSVPSQASKRRMKRRRDIKIKYPITRRMFKYKCPNTFTSSGRILSYVSGKWAWRRRRHWPCPPAADTRAASRVRSNTWISPPAMNHPSPSEEKRKGRACQWQHRGSGPLATLLTLVQCRGHFKPRGFWGDCSSTTVKHQLNKAHTYQAKADA
jgi:hypothetical protein